jgi:hypothetical protein
MFHHPPFTELWVEALTFDAGPKYVNNELIPIIKKYSKVQQLTYGHTHAFERGTIESTKENGDFRIVCAGGGGGDTDRWREFTNRDYPQIHIALDHYFFQLVEIDIANKSYKVSMYSLGNASKARNIELMDSWYRKLNQPEPEKPVANAPAIELNSVVFNSSSFSGDDSLMTVRIQVSDDSSFKTTSIDTMVHWKNVYDVDANFEPIDRNAGIDLTRLSFDKARLAGDQIYYYRVKYRDHNLKWSSWSDATSFNITTGITSGDFSAMNYELRQNYPNPFNPTTTIAYSLAKAGDVVLEVYNALGQKVETLVYKFQSTGSYVINFDGSKLSSGIYFYKLTVNNFTQTRKMLLFK